MKAIDCAHVVELPDELRRICLAPDVGYTVRDLAAWAVRTLPQFTGSMPGILSATRIDRAARLEGEQLTLDNEDHARLLDALAEPACGYPIQPALALAPLLVAIRDAKET